MDGRTRPVLKLQRLRAASAEGITNIELHEPLADDCRGNAGDGGVRNADCFDLNGVEQAGAGLGQFEELPPGRNDTSTA